MELLDFVKEKIFANKILFGSLIALSLVGGFIHHSMQQAKFVSNFQTTGGSLDYGLFKSLVDFQELNQEHFSLDSSEFCEITAKFEGTRISYIQKGLNGLAFTVSSENEELDHKLVQNSVLTLLNSNRLVQKSEGRNILVLNKKLAFIEEKIAQLDSIMLNAVGSFAISKIPSDSYYLYAQQLELEEELNQLARFEIIKPVTEAKKQVRPLIMFLVLYLALGALLFVILSKKKRD